MRHGPTIPARRAVTAQCAKRDEPAAERRWRIPARPPREIAERPSAAPAPTAADSQSKLVDAGWMTTVWGTAAWRAFRVLSLAASCASAERRS